MKGSELFNAHDYYRGHDEWEEVWRRATDSKRRLLHGLIQIAVGYEHLRRGNLKGMRSLLGQGTNKLARFTRRDGIKALRDRALQDAERAAVEPGLTLEACRPPKVMLTLEGLPAKATRSRAIKVLIPRQPVARRSGAAPRR